MGGAKIKRRSATARGLTYQYTGSCTVTYMQNIGVVVMHSLSENIENEIMSTETQMLNDPLLKREYPFT